eukprot:7387377-Prymnesium_polylepis.2
MLINQHQRNHEYIATARAIYRDRTRHTPRQHAWQTARRTAAPPALDGLVLAEPARPDCSIARLLEFDCSSLIAR